MKTKTLVPVIALVGVLAGTLVGGGAAFAKGSHRAPKSQVKKTAPLKPQAIAPKAIN